MPSTFAPIGVRSSSMIASELFPGVRRKFLIARNPLRGIRETKQGRDS